MGLDRNFELETEHLTPDGKRKKRKKGENKDPNRMWLYEQDVANVTLSPTPPPKSDFIEDLKNKRAERGDYTDR